MAPHLFPSLYGVAVIVRVELTFANKCNRDNSISMYTCISIYSKYRTAVVVLVVVAMPSDADAPAGCLLLPRTREARMEAEQQLIQLIQ